MENFDYNIKLWNRYSDQWSELDNNSIEDPNLSKNDLEYLGDEWGNKESVSEVINSWIMPYINKNSRVAEIGVGGGRIASKVAPFVKSLAAFDVSEKMLEKARLALQRHSNLTYTLLEHPGFSGGDIESYDFIYSFDVFVHMDLHLIWRYFNEIFCCLPDKGKAFLHTANLLASDGWSRFSKQKQYKVEGFYFVSPDIIQQLANKAGFKISKMSTPTTESNNFYYKRDLLFVLEK